MAEVTKGHESWKKCIFHTPLLSNEVSCVWVYHYFHLLFVIYWSQYIEHLIQGCSQNFTSQMHLLGVTERPRRRKKCMFQTPWLYDHVVCCLVNCLIYLFCVGYWLLDIHQWFCHPLCSKKYFQGHGKSKRYKNRLKICNR